MTCLGGFGSMGFSGSLAWFLDSRATRNMTGMRNVFLSYSELNSGSFVGCSVSTRRVSCEGSWKCQIPTGIGWVSGIGRGIVYS